MNEKLLEDIRKLLWSIQSSRKGSIGTWQNVYLPQLDRAFIDRLSEEVDNELMALAIDKASVNKT